MKMRQKRKGFTLIELLVVVSIIAILAAILLPVIQSVFLSSEKTRAKGEVVGLEQAIMGYFNEYGRYPLAKSGADVGGNQGLESKGNFIAIMMGNDKDYDGKPANPRKKIFLNINTDALVGDPDSGGQFVDPWERPYRYAMDTNRDGRIDVTRKGSSRETVYKGVAVWSTGREDDDPNDDIMSWR